MIKKNLKIMVITLFSVFMASTNSLGIRAFAKDFNSINKLNYPSKLSSVIKEANLQYIPYVLVSGDENKSGALVKLNYNKLKLNDYACLYSPLLKNSKTQILYKHNDNYNVSLISSDKDLHWLKSALLLSGASGTYYINKGIGSRLNNDQIYSICMNAFLYSNPIDTTLQKDMLPVLTPLSELYSSKNFNDMNSFLTKAGRDILIYNKKGYDSKKILNKIKLPSNLDKNELTTLKSVLSKYIDATKKLDNYQYIEIQKALIFNDYKSK